MEHPSPYAAPGDAPPEAAAVRAASPEVEEVPRFRTMAVIVGVLVGLGCLMVSIFVMVIAALLSHGAAAVAALESPSFYAAMVPVSALGFGAGGFVTGVMARGWERRHALAHMLVSFALIVALGSAMGETTDTSVPGWFDTAMNLAFVSSIFLGAELARRRRLRRARSHGI